MQGRAPVGELGSLTAIKNSAHGRGTPSSPDVSAVKQQKRKEETSWCTEDIPSSVKTSPLKFRQKFNDPELIAQVFKRQLSGEDMKRNQSLNRVSMKGLQSLSGAKALDLADLKYFAPVAMTFNLNECTDISNQLEQFSEMLVEPLKAFVFLQFYGNRESLPLHQGTFINVELIKQIQQLYDMKHVQDVRVVEDVSKVANGIRIRSGYELKRFFVRCRVEFFYPGKYVVAETVIQQFGEQEAHPADECGNMIFCNLCQEEISLTTIVEAAEEVSTKAMKSINITRRLYDKCGDILVDLAPRYADGKVHLAVVGLSSLREAEIEITEKNSWKILEDIILMDLDEGHKEIVQSPSLSASHLLEIVDKLTELLMMKDMNGVSNFRLKQERAIIVMTDTIWAIWKKDPLFLNQIKEKLVSTAVATKNSKRVLQQISNLKNIKPRAASDTRGRTAERKDQGDKDSADDEMHDLMKYVEFLEPFLLATNELELKDFEISSQKLWAVVKSAKGPTLKMVNNRAIHQTRSGMRVGISSANASDNWTNSKLRGGKVINVSINLDGLGGAPLTCQVQALHSGMPRIELSTTHTMNGDLSTDEKVFTVTNIQEFLNVSNPDDVLRMLKYAVLFCGVVKPLAHDILQDIQRFTEAKGLSIKLTSLGPSRSGFASSSAAALNLLKCLYMASGNPIAKNEIQIGSLALLFENRLGLKSGRQDVDGLLPGGVKQIEYLPTEEFQLPTLLIDNSKLNFGSLPDHMLLINSNIPRSTGLGLHRGLNMRHWALLSRDRERFAAIVKSYGIHDRIVDALEKKNYPLLGRLFLDYMACRESIDPGATQSIYDKEMGGKRVLRLLFDPLVAEGLIFGGMFTGAMGGGVAMLVATPSGLQKCKDGKRNIDVALEKLKQFETNEGSRPFSRLEEIKYSVNTDGVEYTLIE